MSTTEQSKPSRTANYIATAIAPFIEAVIMDKRRHLHQEAELEELRLDNDNPNQE